MQKMTLVLVAVAALMADIENEFVWGLIGMFHTGPTPIEWVGMI